jgi:demethylmenaquinone methyltransferase/2-methoxy-6-polyprenyl-1,4-benzoquinol methylase
MPSLDHFGIIAPFYDRAVPFNYRQHMIELVGLPIEGAILDVGGGTGRVAQAFEHLAGRVVVADLSFGMLSQARQKRGLWPVCSEAESLPFPDKTFERIVMIDAFHHVLSQEKTVNELWRVLRGGGRIVIQEPDLRKLSVKFVALFEKVVLMRSHFIAPPRIIDLFTYPGVTAQTELDGFNAWVIVDKN